MPALNTLADIDALKETWQIECKLAQGGDIFLGLRELGPGRYELAGIPNPGKVVGELMSGVNDPLHGSFVRSGSADLKLDPDRVRRMSTSIRELQNNYKWSERALMVPV